MRASWVLSWCAGVAVVTRAAAAGAQGPEGAADTGPADVAVEGPAAAGVATTSRAPAVEVSTARRVRHDGYFGFAIGLGGGNLRSTDGAKGASVAATVALRGGGRIGDRVALGGLLSTSFGGLKSGGVSGFSNLLVEGLFFPVAGRGLGLGAALGVSSAWVREQDASGTLVDKTNRVGAGFGLALGYDFWLARRFNFGLWLRGDGSAGGYGVRAAGTLALTFSWY